MNDFLNKTESRYKKLKIQRFNKFQYKKIIKQLSIAMEKGSPVLPFYCNNSFDFNHISLARMDLPLDYQRNMMEI